MGVVYKNNRREVIRSFLEKLFFFLFTHTSDRGHFSKKCIFFFSSSSWMLIGGGRKNSENSPSVDSSTRLIFFFGKKKSDYDNQKKKNLNEKRSDECFYIFLYFLLFNFLLNISRRFLNYVCIPRSRTLGSGSPFFIKVLANIFDGHLLFPIYIFYQSLFFLFH
jgi:hypothetical protein